jgi:hypothetical protein
MKFFVLVIEHGRNGLLTLYICQLLEVLSFAKQNGNFKKFAKMRGFTLQWIS